MILIVSFSLLRECSNNLSCPRFLQLLFYSRSSYQYRHNITQNPPPFNSIMAPLAISNSESPSVSPVTPYDSRITPSEGRLCLYEDLIERPCSSFDPYPPIFAPPLTIATRNPESSTTEPKAGNAGGRTISFVIPYQTTAPQPCTSAGEITTTIMQPYTTTAELTTTVMQPYTTTAGLTTTMMQQSTSLGELTSTIMQHPTSLSRLTTTIIVRRGAPVTPSLMALVTTQTGLGSSLSTSPTPSPSLQVVGCQTVCPAEEMDKWTFQCWRDCRRSVPRESFISYRSQWMASFRTAHSEHRITTTPTVSATPTPVIATPTTSTSNAGLLISPSPTVGMKNCRTTCAVEEMQNWGHCWPQCVRHIRPESYSSIRSKWIASFRTRISEHRIPTAPTVSGTPATSPSIVTQTFWNSIAVPSLLAPLANTAIQTRETGHAAISLLPRVTAVPSVSLAHAPFPPPPAAVVTESTVVEKFAGQEAQRSGCWGLICGPSKGRWGIWGDPRGPPSKPKAIEPRDLGSSSNDSSIPATESFNRTKNLSAPALLSSSMLPTLTAESERKPIALEAMYMQSLPPGSNQLHNHDQQAADPNTPLSLAIVPSSPLETSLPKVSITSNATKHATMDGGHIVDMIYWPCVLAILVVLIALWISTKSYKVRYRGPWTGEWPDRKDNGGKEEEGEEDAISSVIDDRFLIQKLNGSQSYGTLGESDQTNCSPSGKSSRYPPWFRDDDFSCTTTLAEQDDGIPKNLPDYYSAPPDLETFNPAPYSPTHGCLVLTIDQVQGQSSTNYEDGAISEATTTTEQQHKQKNQATLEATRRDLSTAYRQHNQAKAAARARSLALLTSGPPTSNSALPANGSHDDDTATQTEAEDVQPGVLFDPYIPSDQETENFDEDDVVLQQPQAAMHAQSDAYPLYGSMRGLEPYYPVYRSEERYHVPSQQGATSQVQSEEGEGTQSQGFPFPRQG